MKNNYKISSKKGFTLIELLVVIVIITILTALLTVNFIGARQRARDGQRKSNLYQIQAALELYRSDKSSYPLTNTFQACGSPPADFANYMTKVPCDPTTATKYLYISDGNSYTITACLENDADAERDSTKDLGCTWTSASFTLRNP